MKPCPVLLRPFFIFFCSCIKNMKEEYSSFEQKASKYIKVSVHRVYFMHKDINIKLLNNQFAFFCVFLLSKCNLVFPLSYITDVSACLNMQSAVVPSQCFTLLEKCM